MLLLLTTSHWPGGVISYAFVDGHAEPLKRELTPGCGNNIAVQSGMWLVTAGD